MSLDGCADHLGRTLRDRHDTAGVGKDVQQGVHAADVVEEEEGERAQSMPRYLELLQDRNEVVHRRFARPGGSGREQHKPGPARDPQPFEEFVARRDAGLSQIGAIAAGDGDRGHDLGNIAELGFLRLHRRGQGDDDGAVLHQGQEQGDRRGRKIGLEADHRARRQRSISKEIGPPADRDQQPCVREGLVLPDHGVFDHVRAERVEEKISMHQAPEAFT